MASISFARLGHELWTAASALEDVHGRMESFEHMRHAMSDRVEDSVRRGYPVGLSDLDALTTLSTLRYLEMRTLLEQLNQVYALAREVKAAGVHEVAVA